MSMKKKLLIIGAGGHGRVVADIAMRMERWKEISFLDDDENVKPLLGCYLIGKSNEWDDYINDYDIFVAIGNNNTRGKIQKQLEEAGASIPILIHPSAIIGKCVEIGKGSVIMAGTIINCCTIIGKGCIINTGSTIDHDNKIADYVHLSPGVHTAGMVQVGNETWLGIGSTVSNNINITGRCTVGAGSVIVKDISEAGTYVGVPARRISNG